MQGRAEHQWMRVTGAQKTAHLELPCRASQRSDVPELAPRDFMLADKPRARMPGGPPRARAAPEPLLGSDSSCSGAAVEGALPLSDSLSELS